MFYLVIVAVILCILFKILNVNNSAEKSIFYCKNQKFLEEFLKRAPELELPYVPTRFWGFSGHIQTIIQGVISRLHCPLVNGHRVSLKLTDGATVTYDLYHAIEQHPEHGDFTLAICPGIGNNSESVYIRRVVYNAQLHGYRVCVLNHIGTLATVPVTSPRIFM
jgi:abhydrolase domain-containing protein 2